MTIASTGLAITWPVVVAFLAFDLIVFAVYAWLRYRTAQLQRALYLVDYLGMLHAVQDIHLTLEDIRTNTETK